MSPSEVRERHRSYLIPVQEEESEAQRKARSRQTRQSRTSTHVQEAGEKMIEVGLHELENKRMKNRKEKKNKTKETK